MVWAQMVSCAGFLSARWGAKAIHPCGGRESHSVQGAQKPWLLIKCLNSIAFSVSPYRGFPRRLSGAAVQPLGENHIGLIAAWGYANEVASSFGANFQHTTIQPTAVRSRELSRMGN